MLVGKEPYSLHWMLSVVRDTHGLEWTCQLHPAPDSPLPKALCSLFIPLQNLPQNWLKWLGFQQFLGWGKGIAFPIDPL